MTEVDLLQHARAWTKASASFDQGSMLLVLCQAMADGYTALADEERARRIGTQRSVEQQLAEMGGEGF